MEFYGQQQEHSENFDKLAAEMVERSFPSGSSEVSLFCISAFEINPVSLQT